VEEARKISEPIRDDAFLALVVRAGSDRIQAANDTSGGSRDDRQQVTGRRICIPRVQEGKKSMYI